MSSIASMEFDSIVHEWRGNNGQKNDASAKLVAALISLGVTKAEEIAMRVLDYVSTANL